MHNVSILYDSAYLLRGPLAQTGNGLINFAGYLPHLKAHRGLTPWSPRNKRARVWIIEEYSSAGDIESQPRPRVIVVLMEPLAYLAQFLKRDTSGDPVRKGRRTRGKKAGQRRSRRCGRSVSRETSNPIPGVPSSCGSWTTMGESLPFERDEMKVLHALPTLRELQARGFKTAIASSASWGSPCGLWHEEIGRLGLSDQVDATVICGDVGWRKPAKQIFECALQRLQATPQQCIFVGDDPRWDLAGPGALGIEAVLIDRHGTSHATGEEAIQSLNDLWAIVCPGREAGQYTATGDGSGT